MHKAAGHVKRIYDDNQNGQKEKCSPLSFDFQTNKNSTRWTWSA